MFNIGDEVKFKSGRYQGIAGKIQSINMDTKGVKYMINAIGRFPDGEEYNQRVYTNEDLVPATEDVGFTKRWKCSVCSDNIFSTNIHEDGRCDHCVKYHKYPVTRKFIYVGEGYVFLRDEEEFRDYCRSLTNHKNGYEVHNGSPLRYPCLDDAEWHYDGNGPDYYDHNFMYKEDLEELLSVFAEHAG